MRAETAWNTAKDETLLLHASAARRLLAGLLPSEISRELDDFATLLLLSTHLTKGHTEQCSALLDEVPVRCADWAVAYQQGKVGGLLFFATARFRAYLDLAGPAADEEPAFVELLNAPDRPDFVRAAGFASLTSVHHNALRYAESLKFGAEACRAAERAGYRRMTSLTAQNVATCYSALNSPLHGAAWAQKAVEALPQGQWPALEGSAATTTAETLLSSGRYGLALEQAQRACQVLENIGRQRSYGIALLVQGGVLLSLDRPADALECFEKLRVVLSAGGIEPLLETLCSLDMGVSLTRTGREMEGLQMI